jgi:hypothetical protein
VDIGSRLEPLVDDYLLERLTGSAKLHAQQPVAQEVVLVADEAWEGNTSAYFTVFQDRERYRMYYRGSHFDATTQKSGHREVTCYAESVDGTHWTKPDLGLFEFNGSKQNNIVWDVEGSHCFTPFRDTNPAARAEERYKALTRVSGGLLALRSADGIRWAPMAERPVIQRGTFDSQNLAFWDPHLGKYREYHRAFRGVRDIMTGASDDFLHWTEPQFLQYRDAPTEHLYTNAVQCYPGAPHVLIGFPTRFLPATQQTEPILMVSRDGLSFQRFGEPAIPRSAPADRQGNRSNYMAWGLVQLPGQKEEWSVYATEAYYTGKGSRLRRFSYRRDGLVALTANHEGGEALTRPLRFSGNKLVVNCRTSGNGAVRMEVTDLEGRPLDGLSLVTSQALSGNRIDAVAHWSKGSDLSSLAGRTIRLRLVLQDAELYSIQFQ